MAYKLIKPDSLIGSDILPTQDGLQMYDLIGDQLADQLMDELLHERSACEFVRSQLSEAQLADLDHVDEAWRRDAKAFNTTFAVWHNVSPREKALQMVDYVQVDHGPFATTPIIPPSHWWWWPIDPEQGEGV